jgi:hypothetical protein
LRHDPAPETSSVQSSRVPFETVSSRSTKIRTLLVSLANSLISGWPTAALSLPRTHSNGLDDITLKRSTSVRGHCFLSLIQGVHLPRKCLWFDLIKKAEPPTPRLPRMACAQVGPGRPIDFFALAVMGDDHDSYAQKGIRNPRRVELFQQICNRSVSSALKFLEESSYDGRNDTSGRISLAVWPSPRSCVPRASPNHTIPLFRPNSGLEPG